ncbi:MAG: LuxR C-terminal-related transcriptional regulator [Maribacter sp.]|uniref:LuxR C-terminal-related transcriptional regulator n=1 Tax=Maribacter sp. TaxID=1897614 RepID=UPI0032999B39
MTRKIIIIALLSLSFASYSQYSFEGQIAENVEGKTVYLSIIEDYRKLSRPYFEQIIKKTKVDSLGYFKFQGDNLSLNNRIYRIHVDECSEEAVDTNHFLGRCENSKSILFIANNTDAISFPTSFADEVLCEITSTNSKSDAFLQIDALKEVMAIDFYDYRSEANQKLNSKKWFKKLQDFGQDLEEPLAELYIFDFLSDKRNETYSHYLKDISKNDYYNALGQRLVAKYPNTVFTELYQTEIATDLQMAAQTKVAYAYWKWILGSLLLLSVLFNIYFIVRQKSLRKHHKDQTLGKLTTQEQKIVNEILKDKTNKEIASGLFISLSTVKTHINNLYKKLDVTSRDEIKQLFS